MATVDVIIPYAPSVTPQEMLAEAIESVEDQDVGTEVIVIEDLEEKGPAWARNQGLKRSERRYVAFLDADDLWTTGKISRQIMRMRETGAGLCVEGEPRSTDSFVSGLLQGEIESKTSSIMIDSKQVSTRFNESLDRFEDHLFMIETAFESGVCFCEDLVVIRKHAGGLSARGDTELTYQQRQRMAALLERNEQIPSEMVRKFRRIIHYKSAVQFRKDKTFTKAAIANIRSLRYGLSLRNVRAAGSLPVFMLVAIANGALKRYSSKLEQKE